MIITELYNGQGFGNQLFVYATLRSIAEQNGYSWGIQCSERFKGYDFMNPSMGEEVKGGSGPEGGPPTELPEGIEHYYREYRHALWTDPQLRTDIRLTDRQLFSVKDNTKIDGNLQSEEYFINSDFKEWFKVFDEKNHQDTNVENMCILNFRGGDMIGNPGCWLPRSYWDNAIENVMQMNPNMQFAVVTDDVRAAQHVLPEYPAYHVDISWDFVALKNCRNIICSSSTFACFPLWMNTNLEICIAPKYWFHHNLSKGWWSLGCSIYNYVTHYMDRDGKLFSVDECKNEWEEYKINSDIYEGDLTR